jgi:hypothetical protein
VKQPEFGRKKASLAIDVAMHTKNEAACNPSASTSAKRYPWRL